MEFKWFGQHGLDLEIKLKISKQILNQIKMKQDWTKTKSNIYSSISMKPKTHIWMIQDKMDDVNQLETQNKHNVFSEMT